MKQIRWVGIVACVLPTGCTSEVLSTNGRSYVAQDGADPYVAEARESAVNDLACTSELIGVRVLHGFKDAKFLADGCGTRGVYECATRSDLTRVGFADTHSACEMVLVSKFAFGAGAAGPDATRRTLPFATLLPE